MSKEDDKCHSEGDPEWNKQLINEINKKQGKLKPITEEDRIERILECLDEGAHVDVVDKDDEDNNTALHIALMKGYRKISQILLDNRARTNIPNKNGDTALTLAKALGREDFLNLSKEGTANHESRSPAVERSNPSILIASSSDQSAFTSQDQVLEAIISPLKTPRKTLKRKAAESECTKNCKELRCESLNDEQSELQVISSKEDSQSEEENDNEMDLQETSVFSGENKYAASGSKQTLHGNIYQLKLLMLFVKRGLQEGYAFHLATEMTAAEKFDDVVFRYTSKRTSRTVCRYLQAKHRQDERRKIGPTDLLNKGNGDFSLQKYFVSYRKIKKHPELSTAEFEDCILCTNFDFDFRDFKQSKFRPKKDEELDLRAEDLEASEIGLVKLEGLDVIMDGQNWPKQSARYKLVINDKHELHEILRESSDAYLLAKTLAKHVFNKSQLTLREIFKFYHIALVTHVIDRTKKCFFTNFRNDDKNLSSEVRNFRKIFGAELLRHMKTQDETACEESVKAKMEETMQNKFSEAFGKRFTPTKRNLRYMKEFSVAFLKLIRKADDDNFIVFDMKMPVKKGSDEQFIRFDINTLAEHVLIVQDKKLKFDPKFLEDGTQSGLSDSTKAFQNELKTLMGAEFKTLEKYRFEIKNSPKHWDLLYSTTKLPDDNIKSDETNDFFEKLVFAVNQPNEVDLGKIIRKEIGKDCRFDVLSADLVSNSFLAEMLDWFKEKGTKKGEEGVFYTTEDGERFFKSMNDKINNLICSGLSSAYPERLENYGIEFGDENQELRNFLNNKDKRVLDLTAIGETLPTAIRAHKLIRGIPQYVEYHKLIFVELHTLSSKKKKELVIRCFESRDMYDLLVIDCGSPNSEDSQILYNVYDELLKIMEKTNSPKKLIFITQEIKASSGNQSVINFQNCEKKFDEGRFNNLSKASQKKLLDKQIINLQGLPEKLISFHELLGNSIPSEALADFGDAIDSSMLVKLICGDSITLGNGLKTLGEIEHFYINRTFNAQVFLKADIFRSHQESDVFAISGIDKDVPGGLVKDQAKIQSYGEIVREIPQSCKFISLDNEHGREEFEKLSEGYSRENKNVHWVKCESGNVIWKESRGNIDNLLQYRGVDNYNVHESNASCLTEDRLADIDNGPRVVAISDTAGMGKTTVLTSLATKMKKRKPASWVIKINLIDFTKELESPCIYGADSDQVVKFFVEKLSSLKTDSEKKILESLIKNYGGVALLFDGFDEISPDYKETVMVVLRAIKDSIGVEKLFVSTRPHMSKALEKELGIFSHTTKPFSKIDQIQFLISFWKKRLGWNDVVRLRTYAEAVIETMVKSIHDQVNEFAGIPLQTQMLAEIFACKREGKAEDFETCEEFVRSEKENPRLPTKMNIVDLYERFVDKKCEILYTEKQDISNPRTKFMSRVHREKSLKTHQMLALYTLFKIKVVETLLTKQKMASIKKYITHINEGNEQAGIITGIIHDTPQFIHRSFAEYFAAMFLINSLKVGDHDGKVQEFIVGQILLQREYNIIRSFLNGLLLKISSPYDRECEGEASAIADGSWKIILDKVRSRWSQSIFHVAVQERNDEITKFFLNRLGKKHETSKFLNEAEDRSGRTAMCVAASGQHWDQLKLLVEVGGASVNCFNSSGETPLHWAAFSGNLPVVKWLVKNTANLHAKSTEDRIPLHWAASSGKLEVLEWLIDKTEVDVNSLMLDKGMSDSPLAVFQWLVEEKNANFKAMNDCRKSVMYMATSWGRADLVEWLVGEKGVKLDYEADGGTELVHSAIDKNFWDIVRYVVGSSDFDIISDNISGRTVLGCAIKQANLSDIKWLVANKRIDVNAKIMNGDTLVHAAVAHGRLDVVQWLVNETSVDLTITDANGRTILHKAAVRGSDDMIRFLIKFGEVDVSDLDNDGKTALDLYCEHPAVNRNAAISHLLR